MTVINPQVALQRRDGSTDMLDNTLFEAVTAAQDDCKSRGLWSPKRIMSVGIIRKNGKYKPMRCITIDPAPQPPKTYA